MLGRRELADMEAALGVASNDPATRLAAAVARVRAARTPDFCAGCPFDEREPAAVVAARFWPNQVVIDHVRINTCQPARSSGECDRGPGFRRFVKETEEAARKADEDDAADLAARNNITPEAPATDATAETPGKDGDRWTS